MRLGWLPVLFFCTVRVLYVAWWWRERIRWNPVPEHSLLLTRQCPYQGDSPSPTLSVTCQVTLNITKSRPFMHFANYLHGYTSICVCLLKEVRLGWLPVLLFCTVRVLYVAWRWRERIMWNPVPEHSLLLLISTSGTARLKQETHYERPARHGTSRHGTTLMVLMESNWE